MRSLATATSEGRLTAGQLLVAPLQGSVQLETEVAWPIFSGSSEFNHIRTKLFTREQHVGLPNTCPACIRSLGKKKASVRPCPGHVKTTALGRHLGMCASGAGMQHQYNASVFFVFGAVAQVDPINVSYASNLLAPSLHLTRPDFEAAAFFARQLIVWAADDSSSSFTAVGMRLE